MAAEIRRSVKKQVPPSASSMRPRRRLIAPVNAPRSCPNSSDSSSESASAPQLTLMNGPCARLLRLWMARATSSFRPRLAVDGDAGVGAGDAGDRLLQAAHDLGRSDELAIAPRPRRADLRFRRPGARLSDGRA